MRLLTDSPWTAITAARVRQALGRPASLLRPKSPLALLKDAALVHRLHPLWPTLS